jgi:RNA polymerase sigma-70 factor (family 1)
MDNGIHSDAELAKRIRNKDRIAFDIVYQRHWLRLFRVALRITEDRSAAEDIIQDTFISLWEKGSQAEIRNIEAYLYGATKFRCFMHLRSGSISKKHLDHFAAIVATQSVLQDDLFVKEMEEAAESCIAGLPEKCREVYYLSRVEMLPNKKIAEKLHISPKTVENQITKALKQLRFSLDKFALLVIAILQ